MSVRLDHNTKQLSMPNEKWLKFKSMQYMNLLWLCATVIVLHCDGMSSGWVQSLV